MQCWLLFLTLAVNFGTATRLSASETFIKQETDAKYCCSTANDFEGIPEQKKDKCHQYPFCKWVKRHSSYKCQMKHCQDLDIDACAIAPHCTSDVSGQGTVKKIMEGSPSAKQLAITKRKNNKKKTDHVCISLKVFSMKMAETKEEKVHLAKLAASDPNIQRKVASGTSQVVAVQDAVKAGALVGPPKPVKVNKHVPKAVMASKIAALAPPGSPASKEAARTLQAAEATQRHLQYENRYTPKAKAWRRKPKETPAPVVKYHKKKKHVKLKKGVKVLGNLKLHKKKKHNKKKKHHKATHALNYPPSPIVHAVSPIAQNPPPAPASREAEVNSVSPEGQIESFAEEAAAEFQEILPPARESGVRAAVLYHVHQFFGLYGRSVIPVVLLVVSTMIFLYTRGMWKQRQIDPYHYTMFKDYV